MTSIAFTLLLGAAAAGPVSPEVIVRTDAYSWQGDTIRQGEYAAWAVSPTHIKSTYHARPHYFMPIEQEWQVRNDISPYPNLQASNTLLRAVYNLALDEMVNAVEPDTTLRTGREWAGVWTRDVSYSIIAAMAALQPEASMVSLMRKVNAEGQIVQDTGSGGAWPISTDRMVWALAAWEVYKVTGSRAWLEQVYPIVKRSLEKDAQTVQSARGLVEGETSFIDWREQSYPRWMQTADIAASEALSTNVVHAAAWDVLAKMASALGQKKEAAHAASEAQRLTAAIDSTFWMADKGYYGMYTYGREFPILNPRAEALGQALAVLYDVAPAEKQRALTQNSPTTKYGVPIFFPGIPDVPSYHNNALWPWVAAYWGLANAKAGNAPGALEALGSVVRPAALFTTNKENLNLDNGDIFTELNSSNMLWCLAGNIALTQQMLMGIHFEPDGLRIEPFVPKELADTRVLSNFPYRGARLTVEVQGYGSEVRSLTFRGRSYAPGSVIPAAELQKGGEIKVRMADNELTGSVNHVANRRTHLTPEARIEDGALVWRPIEYAAGYDIVRDGAVVAHTRRTSWPLPEEGAEWQVIAIAADGTPSFASEPRSTRPRIVAQFADEGRTVGSAEVSYPPATSPEGFMGAGFVETDHQARVRAAEVEVPQEGTYFLSVRYANGNGPVNTENKAAVRSLYVNGRDAGTVVLPQRGVGNWDDWGLSNVVAVQLPAGRSRIELRLNPEDENMNLRTNHALLDAIILSRQ